MRQWKSAIYAASLAASLLLPATGHAEVTTEDTRTFGDWTTGVLVTDDRRIHRAAVSSREGYTLLVDRFGNNCSNYQLTITEGLRQAPGKDVRIAIDGVVLQVDNRELHSASGTITASRGATRAFTELTPETPAALHADIGRGQQLRVTVRNDGGETDTALFSLDGSFDALSRNRRRCEDESGSLFADGDTSGDGRNSGDSSPSGMVEDAERDRRLQILENFHFDISGCVYFRPPSASELEARYVTGEEAAEALERDIRSTYECAEENARERLERLQDLVRRLGGRMTVTWTDESIDTSINLQPPYLERVSALRDEVFDHLEEADARAEERIEKANEIMENFDERW